MNGYDRIVELIFGVPDEGTLNIPDNKKVIDFIKVLISTNFFYEYGFDIYFSNNYSKIKKVALFNERLKIRYPHIKTIGQLKFLVNNPDLYGKYDKERDYIRSQSPRIDEGEYIQND